MQTSPISRVVVIRNKQGLHMRPAMEIAKIVSRFDAEVNVLHLGRRVNASHGIDLVTLAAGEGSELTLEAVGSDAQAAVDALAEFVEVELPKEDTTDQ
jgi:phosphotransferase system HPr (HPr) family protein